MVQIQSQCMNTWLSGHCMDLLGFSTMAKLHHFHIVSIQSATAPHTVQPWQPFGTAQYEHTASFRIGHTIPGPLVQAALSFWDFDGDSGRRCLLICPHMDVVW